MLSVNMTDAANEMVNVANEAMAEEKAPTGEVAETKVPHSIYDLIDLSFK